MSRSLCKACGAPIEWARFAAGTAVPLDIDERADANLTIVDGVVSVVEAGQGTRVSHFATCPESDAFRVRNRARR